MKQISLLAGWALLSLAAFCQIPEPLKTVPTPNAMAFLEQGQTDVSHFTGLPNIRVPLAELGFKKSRIPVSLSYNASGFRPDVHASWVGQGWNLDFGGVITRQVNGLPDEFSFYMENTCDCIDADHNANATYNLGFEKAPFDTTYSLAYLLNGTNHFINLNNSIVPETWYLYRPPVPFKGHWYHNSCHVFQRNFKGINIPAYLPGNDTIYKGTKDLQSDEYTFNMMGHSGKFFFKNDNEIEVIADKKYQVQLYGPDDDLPTGLLTPNDDPQAGSTCQNWVRGMSPWKGFNRYPKTFSGFRIIAEDGTIFDFGNRYDYLNATEYGIAENTNNTAAGYGEQDYFDYWQASSWYLAAVTLPEGRTVYFEYERAEYTRSMFISEFSYGIQQNDPVCPVAVANYMLPNASAQSKINAPVYLSRVYSDLCEVNLFYSNTGESNSLTANALQDFKWKKLDSIRYKDNMGSKGVWKFSYFPLANYGQRLFLQSTERYDHAGVSSGEKYRFLYDTTIAFPDYVEGKTDHWGFYNNIDTKSVYGKTNASLDTLRKAVLNTTRLGILTHLYFPTGGYNQFTYELNTYAQKVKLDRNNGTDAIGSNKAAGGLRIRRIVSVDTIAGTNKQTDYYYVNGYTAGMNEATVAALPSSGVLNQYGHVYHWEDQIVQMFQLPSCLQNLKVTLTSNQPLNPVFDDYHIGYTTVIALQRDSGYKRYTYSNHDNGFVDDTAIRSINPWTSPYNHFSSRRQDRGNLLEEASFHKSGKLLERITTLYSPIPNDVADSARTFFPRITLNVLSATNQSQASGPILPATYLISQQIKEYTYRMLPTRETTVRWQMNSNDSIQDVREMAYNNPKHGQVTTITHHESNGALRHEIFKYPWDYTPQTNVLGLLLQDHIHNRVIEKLVTIKDSATAPEKVVAGELNEYALNPFDVYAQPAVRNSYRLHLDTPKALSAMTATVAVDDTWGGTTYWTKDSRYKRVLQVKKVDEVLNSLDYETVKQPHTFAYFGYHGQKLLGTFENATSTTIYSSAYTSFETENMRRAIDDYFTVSIDRDNTTWWLDGVYSTTQAFTGRQSFMGRARYNNGFFIQGNIYVAVLASGNAPFLERYDATTGLYTTLPTVPTLVGQRGPWQVYRFAYSNAGAIVTVNSNGNYMDELRMGSKNFGDDQSFKSYTYVDGCMTEETDHRYVRKRYVYDTFGRLIRELDENDKIVKSYTYQFSGANH